MILPYLVRLTVLSLACFFLAHAVLAIAMNWLAPWLLQLAERRAPSSAARLLLAARLFPSVASILVVTGVCIPSYLWLEPEAAVEQVGVACLAAALLSTGIWAVSAARGLRAIVLSVRYQRHCRRLGRETRLAGEKTRVIDGAGGLFALAGILRPHLVISRAVLQTLSAEELEAALRHERAHSLSRDNLKRLLLLLAPDVLPWGRLVACTRVVNPRKVAPIGNRRAGWQSTPPHLPGLQSLEGGWAKFIELSADDRAVGGDAGRSVSLAAALVQVARLGVNMEASPLMNSLVADGRDLEARVNRLLGAAQSEENTRQGTPAFIAASLLGAGTLLLASMGPATLQAAHRLLEHLIR